MESQHSRLLVQHPLNSYNLIHYWISKNAFSYRNLFKKARTIMYYNFDLSLNIFMHYHNYLEIFNGFD